MNRSTSVAAGLAGLVVAVALATLFYRGGLIAWGALALGIGLLVKIWRKPGRIDILLSAGLGMLAAIAWAGVWFYVISTYESGEVVELSIQTDQRSHNARVWLFEVEGSPVIYYDAPSDTAHALLAGAPIGITRAGETSTRIPYARRADELSNEEANRILEAMRATYGTRVRAADLYYVLLGRPRGRIAVVAELTGA